MNYLDLIGASLSLLATLSFVQARKTAWPLSLCAVGVNLILYCQNGLIGQTLLEIYYGGMTLYGWHQQQESSLTQRLYIRSLNHQQSVQLVIALLSGMGLAYLGIGSLLQGTILVCGIAAQWLTIRRTLQTWPLWVVTDILVIIAHHDAQLPFHTGLNVIYLCMALWGYKTWKELQTAQNPQASQEALIMI